MQVISPYKKLLHIPNLDALILIECKTHKHVVTSVAECETAAAFHDAKQAIPIQYIPNQIGYTQPVTPMAMNNTTTDCFISNNITQKKSKSWNMRYYCLRASDNLVNHFTNHFPEKYHKTGHSIYVTDLNFFPPAVQKLQRCVSI